MAKLRKWSGSLHKSFRLLPTERFGNEDLLAFLQAQNGADRRDIHARLPYDTSRSGDSGQPGEPDPRRYRDLKQVLETCGLLWEDEHGRVWFTEFGLAVREFMPYANERNVFLLAQHAAFALSVCQLRNPTGAGRKYHEEMCVFPFRFIWEAMLALDYRIRSEELNRAIFRTRNEDMLREAVSRIRFCRRAGSPDELGAEAITGAGKNDRLIPIVSLAGFGWTLLNQKDQARFYTVKRKAIRLLEGAVSLPAKHQQFDSVQAYVESISNAACIPKDSR